MLKSFWVKAMLDTMRSESMICWWLVKFLMTSLAEHYFRWPHHSHQIIAGCCRFSAKPICNLIQTTGQLVKIINFSKSEQQTLMKVKMNGSGHGLIMNGAWVEFRNIWKWKRTWYKILVLNLLSNILQNYEIDQ